MEKVRVRFAPSPTGFLHIGGLRTALYNWLFTRKNKGVLILRIEDTDQKRLVPGATEKLIEILNWIGLDWDEGPIIKNPKSLPCRQAGEIRNPKLIIAEKGKFGPYIQSKRLKIYQKYARGLVEKGVAYYCFCPPERLEKLRKAQEKNKLPTRYDGLCRKLNQEEVKNKLGQKMPYVIRLKFPQSGSVEIDDLIRGKVIFDYQNQDDAVLLKSDGFPTYHLASAIDDHLMEISHIIRGEEWLSSLPKHLLIYQTFNWQPPKFAHMSLLLNKDRSKLSKRQGDVAVEDYREKGYLPEAIINFSALLGWNPGKGEEREIFTLKELVKIFSLEKMNKSGAIFDLGKLDWMNGIYIRKKPLQELTELCLPYLIRKNFIKTQNHNLKFKIIESDEIVDFKWLEKVVALEQERMKKLSEITELTEFFFKEPSYDKGLLRWKKMTDEETAKNLKLLADFLMKLPQNKFTKKYLEKEIFGLIKKNNLGVGEMLWPMRVALSGKTSSPGPFEIAEILGKKRTIRRINV